MIPWVKSGELNDREITDTEEYITEEGLSYSSAKVFPSGTLLIALYGATVGKTGILRIAASTNQAVCAVFPKQDHFLSEFMMYCLMHRREDLLRERYGGAQSNISQTLLRNFQIPLPPLPEQHRIAHVLNTIQREITAQDDLIAAAREVKRSLMQRLFTYGPGAKPATTKDTEIGQIPEHWEVVKLGQALQSTQYGLSVRADSTGQYPMLRMNNLVDGRVETSDLKYVDLPQKDFAKFRVQVRDVLFNRTNSYELVGKTAIFDIDGNFTFASYLIRLITDLSRLLPEFLNYYLNWDSAQRRLKMLATRGVSQSNISATKLKQFVIGLPPPEVQEEIACILATADGKIAAEEQRKAALQALFKSMLHQLMTGQTRLTHSHEDIKTQRRKDTETQSVL